MGLIGEAGYTYDEDIELWGRAPEGWIHHRITDIAINANDEVYVLIRGEPWVMVFSPDGELLRTWGEGMFTVPHGITAAPDGSIYTADAKDNRVHKFSPDGELLLTLGVQDKHYGYLSGKPFHHPTDTAIDHRNGDILVTDGYSNASLHRFSSAGKLLDSWGMSGTHPGQFNTLHSIALDRDANIYINDRENHRVQVFTPEGEFLTQWVNLAVNYAIDIDQTGDQLVYIAEDFRGFARRRPRPGTGAGSGSGRGSRSSTRRATSSPSLASTCPGRRPARYTSPMAWPWTRGATSTCRARPTAARQATMSWTTWS
jgi:DNA-binding beta-propeller fold protein YncE